MIISAEFNFHAMTENIEYCLDTIARYDDNRFVANTLKDKNYQYLFGVDYSANTPKLIQISKMLFYTACDILSVDYNDIINKILDDYLCNTGITYNNLHSYLIETTTKCGIEILDDNLCSSLYGDFDIIKSSDKKTLADEIRKSFHKLIKLQEYIDVLLSGETVLANTDVFRTFASNYIYTIIQENCPSYENDEIFEDTIESFVNGIKRSKFEIQSFPCRNLLEFLCTSVYQILKNGYTIKQCSNCGKLFVPYNRSDTIYCDRQSPQDVKKTCKEYGAIKTYQDNLKRNEAMGLYRKIYMQKQMLCKRNPDIKEYADDFERYKLASKQWKSDVKKGIKTEAEYIQWLNTIKSNRR